VDRVHGLWTVQEWLVHGSTMDLTMAGGQSSPELGLVAALRHDDLPRRHERQKGSAGSLAVGSPWAERQRGELAAVESRARWWRSVCKVLRERRVGEHGVEGWWQGLPYIGSGSRGGGRRGGEQSMEVWFKGGELRGRLPGRLRGGGVG
jgi:hypothetical protein